MLYRSFLVYPNPNPDSTTYLNINLVPSQVAILDHPHTPGDHRILIKCRLCLHLKACLRTLYREDRGGCGLPLLTGHREATDHLAMLEITLAQKVMVLPLPVHTMGYLVEGIEGGVRPGCRMMNGRDNEKIIM